MSESPQLPSPNAFYRAQRPERFSDSVVVDKPSLNRSQLEYFLATVTSRSQETAFENFARSLAARRIAPNLLPHTGPTGGGDSKVDSETLPVADVLALGWFEGIGRDAAQERWAFAISAKKKWKPKLESDLLKLVKTGRDYKKAFFITNQFVRDKERAEQEDSLSLKHGIDVRILDRTWVLDAVFSGQLQDLAIETLGLATELRQETRVGPRDAERSQLLEELETRITTSLAKDQVNSRLVMDALRSATTARGLERARTDVDGRFLRARRIAERLNISSEVLKVIYQWAWTSFFWYEDYQRFAELANEALSLVGNTDNAHELERITTLFGLLTTAVSQQRLAPDAIGYQAFTQRLLSSLDRVAGIEEQPSNALHARALVIQARLQLHPEEAATSFQEMEQVIDRAQTLIGFPFEETADLILALEPFYGQLDGYSGLFEHIIAIVGPRKGDVTAAQILLKRGAQQLEREEHLPAIRTIGRALGALYKNETRGELIRALLLAGAAYARADLFWAARGTFIVAASLASDDLYKFGRVTPAQVTAYDRLRWTELMLGRLPQTLDWHQPTVIAIRAVSADHVVEPHDPFDSVLGIHFLNADLEQLRQLERMPEVLEELGLYMAKSALLFALGQPSEVPQEMFAGAARENEETEFMRQWRDQPAADELSPLTLGLSEHVTLHSDVLGCHVEARSENKSPAIDLTESILGGLESLLSTALDSRMVAQEPLLKINVAVSEFAATPFGFRFEYELGRPKLYVACRNFSPHSLSHDEQKELKDRITAVLIEAFAHIIAMPDEQKAIEQLFGVEHALERAVNFTNTFISLGNVLGHNPKTRLDAWLEGRTNSALLRKTVWDEDERQAKELGRNLRTKTLGSNRPGVRSPESQPQFQPLVRHSDLRTFSLIRQKLWNEAGWRGVGYFGSAGPDAPAPMMALLFQNSKTAAEIFEGWKQDLGEDDPQELLRVSIIRGISKSKPTYYRVVLSTEPTAVGSDLTPMQGRAMIVSRIHTMTPASTSNLDRFLQAYTEARSYVLAPGWISPTGEPVFGEPQITKKTLHVREAWQLGRHDPDSPAVDPDDDVIIPAGEKNAPCTELQRWARESGANTTRPPNTKAPNT
jgi:hypothetical protein